MTPYIFGILKLDRPAWIKYLLAKGIPWATYEISELISGTSLDLVYSIKRPLIDFHILGNSIQDGTPSPETQVPIQSVGDNVNEAGLNDIAETTLDGLTYSASDGILSVNGTATNKVNIQSIPFTLSSNTTKILKVYLDSGTANSDTRIGLSFRDSSNTQIDYIQSRVTEPSTKTLTLTDLDHIYLYIVNGSALTNAKIRFKLESGSTATPYSPYNMGVATITKCNRNKFDGEHPVYVNNKILNDSGTEINDNSGGYTKMYIPVNPSTEYTISGLTESGTKRIYYFDKSKTFISRTSGFLTTSNTFTTPANCYYVDIQYYITGNDFTKWQFELGPNVTLFIAHQSTTYPIYTQSPMRAIGEVRDDFAKIGGVWYERHKNYDLILKSNQIVDFNETYNRIHLATEGIIFQENTSGYSNMATLKTGGSVNSSYTNAIIVRSSGGNNQLYVWLIGVESLEDAQTFLTNNEVHIIGKLAEPTLTPCTSEQVEQLEAITSSDTYNGGTNIYSTDIVSPYLETKYWKVR